MEEDRLRDVLTKLSFCFDISCSGATAATVVAAGTVLRVAILCARIPWTP